MKRTIPLVGVIGVAALTCACATQKTAVRQLAARELACPEDALDIDKEDRRIYRVTGCGSTVRVACHDPHESTGASWGWTDPLTAGKRAECETIIDRPASKTETTSARPAAFDRELAAKLVGGAAELARTCGAPSGGPRGEGHARITFASEGTVERVELEAPFTQSEAGRCVEREMMRVSLPRFDGGPVTVRKAFRVD
jgi:hypothetical protein